MTCVDCNDHTANYIVIYQKEAFYKIRYMEYDKSDFQCIELERRYISKLKGLDNYHINDHVTAEYYNHGPDNDNFSWSALCCKCYNLLCTVDRIVFKKCYLCRNTIKYSGNYGYIPFSISHIGTKYNLSIKYPIENGIYKIKDKYIRLYEEEFNASHFCDDYSWGRDSKVEYQSKTFIVNFIANSYCCSSCLKVVEDKNIVVNVLREVL